MWKYYNLISDNTCKSNQFKEKGGGDMIIIKNERETIDKKRESTSKKVKTSQNC